MNKSINIVRRLTVYFGSLSVLVAGLTKYKDEVRTFLGTDSEFFLVFALAVPFLSILVFDGIPQLFKYLNDIRIKNLVTDGTVLDPEYFQLSPRLNDQSQDKLFRLDNAHLKITKWIENTQERILFLSGSSGTGKSSLLYSYTLPAIMSSIHSIVVRGIKDPLSAIITEVSNPGSVWKRSSPNIDNPYKLLDKAQKASNKKRLLIILDQFEETIILSDQDNIKLDKFVSFIKNYDKQLSKNVTFLFVLRSDYIGRLQALELSQMIENINWMTMSAFSIAHSKAFLSKSGMGLSDHLLQKIINHAVNVEDTEGLIRPITLNMIGLILSRKYLKSIKQVPNNIITQYLKDCLRHPEINHYSHNIVQAMITSAGTKFPISVNELKEKTEYDKRIILGVLLRLGNMGLVRRLGEQTTIWEISHDFVADLIRQLLAFRHKKIFQLVRPFISPTILILWIISLIILLPPYLEFTSINALSKYGITVSHVDNNVTVKYLPSEELSILETMKYLKWIRNFNAVELNTDVKGIELLSQFSNLRTMSLLVYENTDFSSISKVKQLERLELSDNPTIDDINPTT